MINSSRFRLIRKQFVFVFLFILTLVGCRIISNSPVSEVIPMIADLPKPQIPEWIETINPIGESPELSQIHVIFKSPLIPLESLDSSGQKKLLNNFEITPKIPGEFRFLTQLGAVKSRLDQFLFKYHKKLKKDVTIFIFCVHQFLDFKNSNFSIGCQNLYYYTLFKY